MINSYKTIWNRIFYINWKRILITIIINEKKEFLKKYLIKN